MAGRKREPISLIMLKGKKHLGKKEIEKRQKEEIKAPSDKVEPPDYLPEDLHAEFIEIANDLMAIGIISNLDVDTLARFVAAREQWVRTFELMRSADLKLNMDGYTKLVRANNTLFEQCAKCASELGMTITSRCRIVVPKAKKEEKTEFEHKFGDV